MKVGACELCNAEAVLYCDSDSAFLCFSCDEKVHRANFLVARHVRQTICSKCNDFAGHSISGTGKRPLRPLCASCSPQNDVVSLCSSSSSACISSTESSYASAPKKTAYREATSPLKRLGASADAKAEGILVNWCKKLGLIDSSPIVGVSSHAVALCLTDSRSPAFRVALATSFWFGLRLSGCSTWQNLKRLQEVSGVPGKVILAAQSKVRRLLREKKKLTQQSSCQNHEEGWDECSN